MAEKEKRKFSRALFHGKGTIRKGGDPWAVSVKDLSLKGVLVHSESELDLSDEVEFKLELSNSEVVIETEGIVVHKHDQEYGIKFTLVEAEGMIHLRSIMEYNTEDFSQIESELFFLRET